MEKKEGRLEPLWDRMPYVIGQVGADLIPNLFVYWSCEPKKRSCEILTKKMKFVIFFKVLNFWILNFWILNIWILNFCLFEFLAFWISGFWISGVLNFWVLNFWILNFRILNFWILNFWIFPEIQKGRNIKSYVYYSRLFSKSREIFHAFFLPMLAWISRIWC